VTLYKQGEQVSQAQTDEHGDITLSNITPGTYLLVLEYEGSRYGQKLSIDSSQEGVHFYLDLNSSEDIINWYDPIVNPIIEIIDRIKELIGSQEEEEQEEDPISANNIKNSTGQLTLNHNWQKVELDQSFSNPVVFLSPISHQGGHPAHFRLRNVQNNSFEVKVEEWQYLDGSHVNESLNYLVLEKGVHDLGNGSNLEVGTLETDHNFKETAFETNFNQEPVVITQAQTYRGGQAIVTRAKTYQDRLELKVQEEEALGEHWVETIGYLALPSSKGRLGDLSYTTFERELSNQYKAIPTTKTAKGFLASITSTYGADPVGIRSKFKPEDNKLKLTLEEEQSKDNEQGHLFERVTGLIWE